MKELVPGIKLYNDDCFELLKEFKGNRFDSVVTDPPYHLTSIVKRFGSPNTAPAQYGIDGIFSRASAGFMGQKWDGGDIAFNPALWTEVLRVLKPGGHLVAFGAPRNYHRLAGAIEDAGFEIRDSLMWLFGTGFPKSHSLKEIEWEGWGTTLKPAFEPIILARKPLSEKTVAANVLKWRTGAINIDACRVGYDEAGPDRPLDQVVTTDASHWGNSNAKNVQKYKATGRWPANICHDGSAEVIEAFPQGSSSGHHAKKASGFGEREYQGAGHASGDSGSAARFFYSAKANKTDRAGSKHPTVKPVALMEWLVKLITPPEGRILDPFAGSGTTGQAAFNLGFRCVMIEREEAYVKDIEARFVSIKPPRKQGFIR